MTQYDQAVTSAIEHFEAIPSKFKKEKAIDIKVHRGDDRISEETRQRVLDAVDKLHYVPNHIARNLRRQRTERVCLVLPHLSVPYYDRIARDLQKVADTHHYGADLRPLSALSAILELG
jgi:DNA-binding LacI/PurR family transcriptional regulator